MNLNFSGLLTGQVPGQVSQASSCGQEAGTVPGRVTSTTRPLTWSLPALTTTLPGLLTGSPTEPRLCSRETDAWYFQGMVDSLTIVSELK